MSQGKNYYYYVFCTFSNVNVACKSMSYHNYRITIITILITKSIGYPKQVLGVLFCRCQMTLNAKAPVDVAIPKCLGGALFC